MTRNNAREIAVHLVFGLEFGARSAEEVLKSELSRERFEALGQESPLYAQYPNEKQREYIRALVEGGLRPRRGAGRLHQPLRGGLVPEPDSPHGPGHPAHRHV